MQGSPDAEGRRLAHHMISGSFVSPPFGPLVFLSVKTEMN